MKKEQLEKVQAEVSAWAYLNQLSPVEKNFRLKMLMREEGDTFQIYSYENEDLKRSVMIYYHEETKEYKLMITIGLTQFCAIEYISADLAQLEKILRERFDNLLGDISSFNEDHMSIIIKEKKIMQWDYIDKLPQEICGFRLFINPREPVKVINGSYIIIDYCDFAAQSNTPPSLSPGSPPSGREQPPCSNPSCIRPSCRCPARGRSAVGVPEKPAFRQHSPDNRESFATGKPVSRRTSAWYATPA